MALPSINRMFITAAWLESILYGMHPFSEPCVLFGVCMYALFHRYKPLHWINTLSCVFHISIATAHNILSLLLSLEAFTNPAIISIPDGSSIYLFKNTTLTKTMGGLFLLNVHIIFVINRVSLLLFQGFALNLLLIWRFYVVWSHKWILAFVLLILEAAQFATGVANFAMVIIDRTFSNTALALGKASCACNLTLTISVTSGIAYRLWRAGRHVSGLAVHNSYKATIYTIIESGAIYTSSIVVLCALYQAGNDAFIVAINVVTQIATLTPLLLIASLSFGLMHRNSAYYETSTPTGPAFARPIQVTITQETRIHPIDTMDSSTQSRKSQSIRAYHDDT
ncbi:uncharacterized protein EDB93DRAFT_1231070 [Suillus bovinus]|uniref:uncharacterized protein n=1 Tax=Suillus bovinus TaxID=48563 RepID=UPI001B876180|nr:uncharacterized protein EDB93DRAFT_1231070 [Suillus bovinus]KAG2137850.1 hypothetical protein EDB93DRAFT_1231070 [Suillus bovinus]